MLEAEITDIARGVWEAMFGLELTVAPTDEDDGPSLTSIVHIEGAWQGAVTLRCPVALAAELTVKLFGRNSDADMRDLFGELANQLGGNIKAMLPGPCSLSLPAVALGTDYDLRVVDAATVVHVTLACQGSPIVVTVLRRSE